MNVTKDRFNNRQLHMEDYLQMVSAEQKEYAEVLDYQRIAENNHIITDFWANSRKGCWRMGQVLNVALTNKVIVRLGYISMTDYYLKVCEN